MQNKLPVLFTWSLGTRTKEGTVTFDLYICRLYSVKVTLVKIANLLEFEIIRQLLPENVYKYVYLMQYLIYLFILLFLLPSLFVPCSWSIAVVTYTTCFLLWSRTWTLSHLDTFLTLSQLFIPVLTLNR